MLRRFNLCYYFMLILSVTIFSFSAHAENAPLNGIATGGLGKAGKDYISLGVTLNEFRSIELVLDSTATGTVANSFFPETAQTYAYSFTYGTYINDYFKTELRAGSGFIDDTVKEAMDVNMSYWLGWYIGFTHPITDYMSGYAQYGLTHYEADITRREITTIVIDPQFGSATPVNAAPSTTRMEEGLFGTSFSTSWLLGLDFSLVDNWFLAFEYGRLLRDTDSNIKVYQAGTHLRYEF